MVDLVSREVKVPKNVDEVRMLIVGLVEDIKAKKELQALIAENLQPLLAAVEGIEKMGEEVSSPEFYNSLALLGGDVARVLMQKAPVAAPTA
jgi:hypothetical protein